MVLINGIYCTASSILFFLQPINLYKYIYIFKIYVQEVKYTCNGPTNIKYILCECVNVCVYVRTLNQLMRDFKKKKNCYVI